MEINHITFSVSHLKKSIEFYETALDAKILVEGERMAYFDLAGVWLALNVQTDIPRNEISHSYTHMAFTVTPEELQMKKENFTKVGISYDEGRDRDKGREGHSIYFSDPDGHRFELHTGSRDQRIEYYKEEKKPMRFYEE
ncbi:metallothiol transferase FosB [Geomicrobium sp. JCM 19039]|uniref:metallothiol transferase FosB n=1 Tax=Geomicrobium sp. JCM 19039 TaxID=1460636 RepID=UPI00045F3409|nr:metallothiol transferase FosB [Geomicrobium sp. JCM 19039]GAK13300.1 fosfomycin resistance protein FosB [Geomicrobium sp. JCM 19039]